MDDITDMIFKLYSLHLEQYYIQQQHNQKFQLLCYQYWVFTSADIYSPRQGKYPTLCVS